MACNVGGIERPVRIVLGILLIGIGAFAGLPPVGTGIALAMGTIALVTGAIGFCPVWTLLGINTCPLNAGKKSYAVRRVERQTGMSCEPSRTA